MQIKTHLGVSVDGFIASSDGRPTLLSMPSFESGRSHGHPEFIADCGAVVMGRNTFIPALGSSVWPWGDHAVFVLTSRPLPENAPSHVVAAATPEELLTLMRKADFEGNVHLVGGQRTVEAFRSIGALDILGVVVLPVLLGSGTQLTLPGGESQYLRLESTRTFSDGAIEHLYSLAAPVA